MKKIFILSLIILFSSVITHAQNTILEARGKAIGTVVTIKGIVTHGGVWGPIRYFQDNTAGIAAYAAVTGPSLTNINQGDSVTITGTLKNYNGLLELDPLANVVIRSSGNPVPAPIVLIPAQVGETYEGRLVQINDATFTDAGGVFGSGKTYTITANGGSVNIYINKLSTDIIGQPIPNGLVNLTAILSQFSYTSFGGYQLLPRSIADIHKTSTINLTSSLNNTNFTKTELDFSWTTNIASTTQMFYGPTIANFKANVASGTGGATSHSIALTGLTPGQITWVQAFSVNGDTAFSGIMPFATISNSTGNIKAYFNTPVNNTYSTGVNAIYLNQSIDDTLINYINRAKYTIDMAIYNLNNSGLSNISTALKAAAARGVTVRVIGCGTTANVGIKTELAGSAVHTLIGPDSPPRDGLMHNKFLLFDTESTNPNDPLVWTGSTNFTSQQINLDANNVIIVQDQSLARAYKIEFEEMWGSSVDNADAVKARFGSTKKNNTPHEFSINGKRVECYFSPTDGVNAQIVQHIGTANNDLSIATMLLTRDEIASAIALSKTGSTYVNMLTDAAGNNGTTVNTSLTATLGTTHYVYYTGNSGIMHNKYMIIDQNAPESDPMVWTGSHNWSAAADNDNDENTLVIHDATLANIYYQNFAKLFVSSNGVLTGLGSGIIEISDKKQLKVFPNPAHNGNVNLTYYLSTDELGTLQLIDITGKMVYNSKLKLTSGENTLKYNFPASYKGIYLIRLITPSKVSNQKVIFE